MATRKRSRPATAPAVTPDDEPVVDEAPATEPAEPAPAARPRRRRPVWMIPTPDGLVPEHELRRGR
ncbi:hypothetical protein BJF85_16715 [Saccharomonospora sp. CUA-673]|uniref:hypothetical protein n=1 Tax=Saccharomonospora sp. CUA-673 TaxID=1904969 RepID=UPI00096026D1|nr:hypothetical protein [Saccharomonospora sp. CUA-673]OLT46485.1 hypothetical protein BJF85_16715 [Saccharomonospora sp. CUA-673]